MTPSMTFQWPPSPSGTFQPDRSRPLNSATKPAGGALSAPRVASGSARPSRPPARAQAPNQRVWGRRRGVFVRGWCMVIPSRGTRAARPVGGERLPCRVRESRWTAAESNRPGRAGKEKATPRGVGQRDQPQLVGEAASFATRPGGEAGSFAYDPRRLPTNSAPAPAPGSHRGPSGTLAPAVPLGSRDLPPAVEEAGRQGRKNVRPGAEFFLVRQYFVLHFQKWGRGVPVRRPAPVLTGTARYGQIPPSPPDQPNPLTPRYHGPVPCLPRRGRASFRVALARRAVHDAAAARLPLPLLWRALPDLPLAVLTRRPRQTPETLRPRARGPDASG